MEKCNTAEARAEGVPPSADRDNAGGEATDRTGKKLEGSYPPKLASRVSTMAAIRKLKTK